MEVDSEFINAKIKNVADKIRKIRNDKGISAREMSIQLGQNVNYINLIENGKRKPSLEMFLLICEYFQTEPDFFFKTSDLQNKQSETYYYLQIIEQLSDKQKRLLADFIKSIQSN